MSEGVNPQEWEVGKKARSKTEKKWPSVSDSHQFDWVGVSFGLLFAGLWSGAAYALWPNGVLTVGDQFRFVGSLLCGLMAAWGLLAVIDLLRGRE